MFEHIPDALQTEAAKVIALLNGGYKTPKSIRDEVALKLKYPPKGAINDTLAWLGAHEDDAGAVLGALVEYALRMRCKTDPHNKFFEEIGYTEVFLDGVMKHEVRTETSIQAALIALILPIIPSINAISDILPKEGMITAVVQRGLDRMQPGGRIIVHPQYEDEYYIRYQLPDDCDEAMRAWFARGALLEGVTPDTPDGLGYVMRSFRMQFPAWAAAYLLKLADVDQWQPVR